MTLVVSMNKDAVAVTSCSLNNNGNKISELLNNNRQCDQNNKHF